VRVHGRPAGTWASAGRAGPRSINHAPGSVPVCASGLVSAQNKKKLSFRQKNIITSPLDFATVSLFRCYLVINIQL